MTTVARQLSSVEAELRRDHDPQYADMLREYLDYGEPMVGLEMVIDNLYEDDQQISTSLGSLMRAVGRQLGLDEDRYMCLLELERSADE